MLQKVILSCRIIVMICACIPYTGQKQKQKSFSFEDTLFIYNIILFMTHVNYLVNQ